LRERRPCEERFERVAFGCVEEALRAEQRQERGEIIALGAFGEDRGLPDRVAARRLRLRIRRGDGDVDERDAIAVGQERDRHAVRACEFGRAIERRRAPLFTRTPRIEARAERDANDDRPQCTARITQNAVRAERRAVFRNLARDGRGFIADAIPITPPEDDAKKPLDPSGSRIGSVLRSGQRREPFARFRAKLRGDRGQTFGKRLPQHRCRKKLTDWLEER